ncbi:diguanylate cyclase domain-containing protein [Brevundimonas halotolerans]|uniref:Two-component system cell cycle response regulator PopA n=1 Tax=Brevundimonas halotolerans TaxID=69670 RepID=A0A7W9E5S2_9CAUL|nr:diguanylate cyclase [Brevundimonas halotolerans]MBB5659647.1 two-component system cell cycle response regulator PopA [Brevundimonas halotolerans]
MDFDPRILVVTGDETEGEALCRQLDSEGWTTITAPSPEAAAIVLEDFPIEAAVLVAGAGDADVSGVAARLKGLASPRYLPVIALMGRAPTPEESTTVDLAMTAPAHPVQLRIRLEQLVRAALAEEELNLRIDTFRQQGQAIDLPVTDLTPVRVLAAGKPDRRFLALSNALTEDGAEVVAAPTPYTAFDYLHESPFDAAVLWGAEDHAPALSIASGMKRNTRLYHIPVMLYLNDGAQMDASDLFGRGFADVAAADTDERETARRLLAMARFHRRQTGVRRALESVRGSGLTDPDTGLFTRDLFAQHLGRVSEASRERRRPLSLCVLKVTMTDPVEEARRDGWLARALPQIGTMVSRLIRTEDTAARLSSVVFALALPGTTEAQARIAAQRIVAVIGCTAFEAGPGRSPFVVDFELGVAEQRSGEAPARTLERASASLATDTRVAS